MKPEQETIPQGSYKCVKCGNYVTKGEICSCRKNSAPTLNSVMIEQNKKKTSDFCVYCRRALKPDEKCNCIGEGFAITVKPEQFNGRKCSYCGKILVGDGTCVCEKIMTKSVPSSPEDGTIATKKPPLKVYTQPTHDISAEMAELEAKINKKFESIKDSLTKGGSTNSNDTNDNSKN